MTLNIINQFRKLSSSNVISLEEFIESDSRNYVQYIDASQSYRVKEPHLHFCTSDIKLDKLIRYKVRKIDAGFVCLHDVFCFGKKCIIVNSNGDLLSLSVDTLPRMFDLEIKRSLRDFGFYSFNDPVFIFEKPGNSTYYHFMVEMLPQVDLYNQYIYEYTDKINVYSPKKFAMQGLKIALNKNASINWFKGYPICHLKKLFYPLYSNKNILSHFGYNFYQKIRRNFDINLNSCKNEFKIIYAVRGDSSDKRKSVFNEESLINYCINNNIEVVQGANHSVKEQVEIFKNSNVIIGIHGSNLVNTLFCSPGATVIEIMPHDRTFGHFCDMSSAFNLDHHVIFAETYAPNVVNCNEKLINKLDDIINKIS